MTNVCSAAVSSSTEYRVRDRSSSDMFGKIILAFSILAWASAQIPNLGFCPEYIPMANFNMQRFLGVWYEAERYFQLSEVVSRCVMTNYTRGIDGKYRVSNQVTNRFTGIKRILEGEIKPPASKAEEGKLQVKYTTIPLTPETKYSVLETDYDSYAVLWSCQGVGPVHAQSAWVMTRERIPSGKVLQEAYGVLDKYKISKTFFVKTDQSECSYGEQPPVEVELETEKPVAEKRKRKPQTAELNENVRSDANLDDKIEEKKKIEGITNLWKELEPTKLQQPVETVPERILNIEKIIKEESGDSKDKTPFEKNVAENQ